MNNRRTAIASPASVAVCVLLGMTIPITCHAHKEYVHMQITGQAFNSSVGIKAFLNDDPDLSAMSGTVSVTAPDGIPITLSSIMPYFTLIDGSFYEDEKLYVGQEFRCVNHFYTLTPSRVPGQVIGLTDSSDTRGVMANNVTNSFAWGAWKGIIGPSKFGIAVGPNTESWQNARDAQFGALTNSTRNARFDAISDWFVVHE
ncbi:MAG: hypothetical protein ABSD57_10875 [Verrucomicrobiota bacterium]|jgi:hypothetical protein